MRRTPLFAIVPIVAALSGCEQLGIPDGPDPIRHETCDTLVADFVQGTREIRSCTDDDECGQVLTGTSCGCTNDWVARNDADPERLYGLIARGADLECELGLVSDCSCPPADGFACVDQVCQWRAPAPAYDHLDACSASEGVDTRIEGIAISGGALTVTASYSGGCADHAFTVCWPDQSFMESWPVQVRLELLHQTPGDPCEAWITDRVTVDLAPLAAAYREAYGSRGRILVNVGDHQAVYGF
jgi:hypothetical protein